MKPLTASQIQGNWATVVLPIQEDEQIDFARLADELDVLISTRPNGLYTNGTTGEFYTQTEEEFDRVSELTAEHCQQAGTCFQLGASHMSPQISLERVKRAAELRPSAIQVILADWFPLTHAEAVDCLSRFAEAADPVGLVLYNPPHAKRVLSPEEIGRLKAEAPSLVGVKVAGGGAAWYAEMREHLHDVSVFVPGHFLATGYSRGAAGAYSNVACLSPSGAQRWYEQMGSDLDAALELESRIQAFMNDHILPLKTQQGYCNAALDKCLAVIGNWSSITTRMRWPYRSVPQEAAERLRDTGRKLLPELFSTAR